MVNNVTGESMLQITVDQLEKTLCASTILGDPVEAGNRIIIPVAEFGFGFGGAEGSGGAKEGKQSGGSGTGGGGGVSAVALILIDRDIPGPEGVQVISLKKKSEIAEVITTLGETVGPHVSKAIEKGSEMMQRKSKVPAAPREGKEIPISSGEEEEA